jgi:hypothetical protein
MAAAVAPPAVEQGATSSPTRRADAQSGPGATTSENEAGFDWVRVCKGRAVGGHLHVATEIQYGGGPGKGHGGTVWHRRGQEKN